MHLSATQLRRAQLVRAKLILTASDDNILRALARYHYLSARQIVRLLYSPGSLSYVQARLKVLCAAGYLRRCFLPRPSRTGSAPLVYALSRRSASLLTRQGIEARATSWRSASQAHSYLFLAHTLAVNDVLISAERLCQLNERFELSAMQHERDLKRRPTPVTLDDNLTVGVVPDGWLDIRVHLPGGDYQCCLALELDRGTIQQRAWRQKLKALLAWSRGPYLNVFGTSALTIAVACTTGPLRRQQLLSWTEAELRTLNREEDAALFRFCAESALQLEPETYFLGPGWYRPFRKGGQPLIEAPGQQCSGPADGG